MLQPDSRFGTRLAGIYLHECKMGKREQQA